MIGHTTQIMLFSLSLMGSLILPTFGEGTQYLRRKTDALSPIYEMCTPTSSNEYEYYSKVYVLLELDGSRENNEFIQPYPQDIQSIDRAFVDAYEYLTPCDRSIGSNRGVVSADVIDGIKVPTSADNPAKKHRKGSATWLVEITMTCNSCENDDGKWQLFFGGTSPTPLKKNNCICDGPVQTDFVNKFRELFAANKIGNLYSDITVLNANQIPLLLSPDGTYNTEFCSSEEYSTTYSYDGVCPGRSTTSPTESPTPLPTAAGDGDDDDDDDDDEPTPDPTPSPSSGPTPGPTIERTPEPTTEPTSEVTSEPTSVPGPTYYFPDTVFIGN